MSNIWCLPILQFCLLNKGFLVDTATLSYFCFSSGHTQYPAQETHNNISQKHKKQKQKNPCFFAPVQCRTPSSCLNWQSWFHGGAQSNFCQEVSKLISPTYLPSSCQQSLIKGFWPTLRQKFLLSIVNLSPLPFCEVSYIWFWIQAPWYSWNCSLATKWFEKLCLMMKIFNLQFDVRLSQSLIFNC